MKPIGYCAAIRSQQIPVLDVNLAPFVEAADSVSTRRGTITVSVLMKKAV